MTWGCGGVARVTLQIPVLGLRVCPQRFLDQVARALGGAPCPRAAQSPGDSGALPPLSPVEIPGRTPQRFAFSVIVARSVDTSYMTFVPSALVPRAS